MGEVSPQRHFPHSRGIFIFDVFFSFIPPHKSIMFCLLCLIIIIMYCPILVLNVGHTVIERESNCCHCRQRATVWEVEQVREVQLQIVQQTIIHIIAFNVPVIVFKMFVYKYFLISESMSKVFNLYYCSSIMYVCKRLKDIKI